MKVVPASCFALMCGLVLFVPPVGAAPPERHVLLISVDGLHSGDLVRFVAAHPSSTLAGLSRSGKTYVNASAPIPSDSYPGFIALVTGGMPRTTGIYYDEFYDRALSPPSSAGTCDVVGTVVRFDKGIEIDPARIDGGGGIDPSKLPRDPTRGCRPVYPHDALRVNTVFEVIRSLGGRTAWSDKHLSYEIANGPSGSGVDDLFDPEIAAGNVSATIAQTQAYDDLKVAAVINEIDGYDHTAKQREAVPALLGMNFQAVTTAQVTQGNGYLDASGAPSAGLAAALNHVDESIGKMVLALRVAGISPTTTIIVTAKHGQSPVDVKRLRYIEPATIRRIVDRAGPNLILKQNQGDGVLLWLNDPARTGIVAQTLRENAEAGGFAEVFSGPELSDILASPKADSRAPDILVRTVPGVLYLVPPRIAAHGGMNAEDLSVALLVSRPDMPAKTVAERVTTTQVAPTILELLGIDPSRLTAVQREGTAALPLL